MKKTKVFVVHGRDTKLLDTVLAFLNKQGVESIVLCDMPNAGGTILEKLEKNSYVDYAIILYTPCDLGCLKDRRKHDNLKARARQNVVFEHGLFMGKLGRENISVIVNANLDLPSDVAGIGFIPYRVKSNDWKIQLGKELQNAGFKIGIENY